MAEEIRGLNVKFDADFSEFKKNMKAADKDIGSTQRQLKSLQDSLKLQWDPKKFTQAQQQAQKALAATEEKASLLRSRLVEIEKAGVTDKNRDEYNYLSEQLEKTDLSVQKLKQQMEDLDDLKLSNLTKGIDNVADKLDKASQKTKGLSAAAVGLGAGLVAVGIKTVEHADEIATLAKKYELSAESLQRFNYIALQTDVKTEAMYQGFNKVRLGVSQLASGVTSGAVQAFEQLNLSFDGFEGTEDQFYEVIGALSEMEDQTKMLSLANMIFGDDLMGNLLPLIYTGRDAIRQYNQEFDETGALTNEQVAELSKLDGELDRMKIQYANVSLQLGTSFLPLMREFSTVLTEDILPTIREVVEWYKGLDENQQKAVLSLLLLTAALSPTLKLMSSLGKVTSSVVKWLAQMDKATVLSAGKWLLLGAAVASVFAVIANWDNMNNVQRVVALLGALSAAALAAAIAFGAFHSAWSMGLAVAGIVAGITAVTAAVRSAKKEAESGVSISAGSFNPSIATPDFKVPNYSTNTGSVTNNESNYVDNSNVTINIEKNEYMTEDDIIRAVNKGLKQAKQSRT